MEAEIDAEIDARDYLVVIHWSAPILYDCSIGDSHCKRLVVLTTLGLVTMVTDKLRRLWL